MADASRVGLRKAWFQIHKWIGLLLVVALVPLSLTGSALVWHDWLDETINPARYAASGKPVALAPAAYVAAARRVLPVDQRISQLRFPEADGPVIVSAMRAAPSGPAQRMMVWLDPADGRVLDVAGGNDGLVRWLHNFHGNLTVPGVGRQIVGWLGAAMLISCLSGIWLWWPVMGRWTRGLRWARARNFEANLHHQTGFWVALPLAMLSFTGVWISFPQFFATLSGSGQGQSQRMRGQPLETPLRSPDAALAAASHAGGGRPVSISWPTDTAPAWRVSLAPSLGDAVEYAVDDRSGRAKPKSPSATGSTARLMRRLHDGTGMGPIWQILIFVGGLLPAVLGITGVIMWLRARSWRSDVARRRRGEGGGASVVEV